MNEFKLRWRFPLAALALWVTLAGAARAAQDTGLAQRRAWAEDLLEEPLAEDLARALEAVASPDLVLRRSVIEYLGAVQLEGEPARTRLAALAARAREEGDPLLRSAALRALAKVGGSDALAELIALLSSAGRAERDLIARLTNDLAQASPPAREALNGLVIDSFLEGSTPLSADVLALLLPTYGKHLAERSRDGITARDRAPLVLGRRHSSAAVRRAAERGLEALLNRLRDLERFDEAENLLARFAEEGVASRGLLFLRAVGSLHEGGSSPDDVLAMTRRLDRSAGELTSFAEERWRARGALLEANALIALDRNEEAAASLERSADLYRGLLARRLDRNGEQGAAWQRDLLVDCALVDFAEAFRLVASGFDGGDPGVLARLRKAHIWLLRADRLSIESDVPGSTGLDLLFAEVTSPYRCVFATQPHKAWPAARALAVQAELGRALASISAREMPGFEPFEDLTARMRDPVLDPERKALLNAIAQGRLDALQREITALGLRRLKQIEEDPALEQEYMMLSYALRQMSAELRDGPSLAERFFDLRRPSTFALLFAEFLRREGRDKESLDVAKRLFETLQEKELSQQYAWAVELAAQAKLSMGGSTSDMGEAAAAERLMQEALELYESLQGFLKERGAAQAAKAVDDDRAGVLVSMAVNANVKGQDPVRAAEFFERAYELRQDDFMRILLACYRARSGDREEALELIAGVPDSPGAYYNLACTYALLGESQTALEWLERDFRVNRTSAAALEKQKSWAREDPDLGSLRGDPAFELLTKAIELPTEESEGH